MPASIETPWLALLLALNRLETPLSDSEKTALAKTGMQLEDDPEDAEEIAEKLLAKIAQNPALYEIYERVKAKLDSADDPMPPHLEPTPEELERELPPGPNLPRSFGRFKGKPDLRSKEIINITRVILTSEDPAKSAKELSFSARYWELPDSPIVQQI